MNLLQFCSDEIIELAKAMLKVQANLQPALKDKDNPFTHSRYATLNSVMEACRAALLANGIWMTQHPVPLNGGEANCLGLVTKLVHAETGQWQASLLVMPLPKTDPQGYGSAITYARRYALSSLIGIVAEDDDADLATNGKAQPTFKKKTSSSAMTLEKAVPAPKTIAKNADKQQFSNNILSQMPKLDGIDYSVVTTQDNRLCIVANGDTRTKKQLLQQAGFSWSENRKMWWRYADVS